MQSIAVFDECFVVVLCDVYRNFGVSFFQFSHGVNHHLPALVEVGMNQIVYENIVRAISIHLGHDPQNFSLTTADLDV